MAAENFADLRQASGSYLKGRLFFVVIAVPWFCWMEFHFAHVCAIQPAPHIYLASHHSTLCLSTQVISFIGVCHSLGNHVGVHF